MAARRAVERLCSEYPKPEGIRFSYGTAGFRDKGAILGSTCARSAFLAAIRSVLLTREETQSRIKGIPGPGQEALGTSAAAGGRGDGSGDQEEGVLVSTGVMITASHNPAPDNGVKLADKGGGMLAVEWEPHAEALANAEGATEMLQCVSALCDAVGAPLEAVFPETLDSAAAGRVLVAHDTRETADMLTRAAVGGAGCVPGVQVVPLGLLTTPQLHWLVREANLHMVLPPRAHQRHPASTAPPQGDTVEVRVKGEEDYYGALVPAFYQFLRPLPGDRGPPSGQARKAIVDGANGVGAPKLLRLLEALGAPPEDLWLDTRNGGGEGEGALNSGVGADFVQKEQRLPRGIDPVNDDCSRCLSFDGDADRIVFFYVKNTMQKNTMQKNTMQKNTMQKNTMRSASPVYVPEGGTGTGAFSLLDGDKIACLCAQELKALLLALCQQTQTQPATPDAATPHTHTAALDPAPSSSGNSKEDASAHAAASAPILPGYGPVTLGVVQTAYANGASTAYLKAALGGPPGPAVEVVCTKTGVKHLHRAAEEFDVGVYFEANGHGTVLFRPRLIRWLQDAWADREGGQWEDPAALRALGRLEAASRLQNQAVGDALANLLLVEVILRTRDWTYQRWDALYTDVPCCHLKVRVHDKSAIRTDETETRVREPAALQTAINKAVGSFTKGRAFVRPSGTEDVVRVYAEGESAEDASALAKQVADAVRVHAGGLPVE